MVTAEPTPPDAPDRADTHVYSSAREPRRVAAEAVRTVLRTFCADYKVIKTAELRRLAKVIEERERREKTEKTRKTT